jgi:hypothetical protein
VAHMIFSPVVPDENQLPDLLLHRAIPLSPEDTQRRPNGSVLDPARHPISPRG